jgi:hypothetical protein
MRVPLGEADPILRQSARRRSPRQVRSIATVRIGQLFQPDSRATRKSPILFAEERKGYAGEESAQPCW